MKTIYVTNFTLNSNFAIYIGAYIGIIQNLAILIPSPEQSTLYLTPILKHMNISYKIYSDENSFIEDIKYFRPDTLLYLSYNDNPYTMLNKIVSILEIDIICINSKEPFVSELLDRDWYSVAIYNPKTTYTTYVCHTNAEKNIPPLMLLNNYQTIKVEWH